MSCAPEPNYYGRQLIRALKSLREQVWMTQQEAGDRLNITLQKLSRFENGQLPGWHELRAMLDLYGVLTDDWDEYLELWELAKKPGWWRKYNLKDPRYVRMEDEASIVYEVQMGYLPELLQTEEYARKTFAMTPSSTRTINSEVGVRMRRQDRLTADRPLHLHTIVHEPVLSQEVDRAQLTHLLKHAQLPNVTLQVLPQTGLHEGLRGALALLSFDDAKEPDIAFSRTSLGWSDTQDTERTADARRILDRLAGLALSGDDSLRLLMRLAYSHES
jgi:transcriptional regulator with XRE-family HTH domain